MNTLPHGLGAQPSQPTKATDDLQGKFSEAHNFPGSDPAMTIKFEIKAPIHSEMASSDWSMIGSANPPDEPSLCGDGISSPNVHGGDT
jgi:hypothetical protein